MAWTKTPTTHQPGYIYIPASMANAGDTGLTTSTAYLCFKHTDIKDVVNFTPTEADEADGDWRYIVMRMVDAFYDDYAAMATADRPSNLTVSRSGLVGTGSTVTRTWTISATLATSGLDVADES